MLIFNLLPAYPMDGGRLLQCILWPKKGYKKSTEIVTITSMVIAVLMASFGFVYEQTMLFVLAAEVPLEDIFDNLHTFRLIGLCSSGTHA